MRATVVVPAYNALVYVKTCVQALRAQTLPAQLVFVDNGSTDGTVEALQSEPGIELAQESIASSYAARNRGSKVATGSVLAFMDSDCTPRPDWLEAGLRCLQSGPDMAAGRVEFSFRDPSSAWEVYDSLFNMDNAASVKQGCAKTANLFVRREVFERVGPFDERATSGEDVAWTRRAVRAGFRLAYCPDAIVSHPTRGAVELIRKALRTGGGALSTTRSRFPKVPSFLLGLAFLCGSFIPPSPGSLKRRLHAQRPDAGMGLWLRVFLVAYVLKGCRALGLLVRLCGIRVRA
jgi:glycosyltransferase involved in cell wall biosynthesis